MTAVITIIIFTISFFVITIHAQSLQPGIWKVKSDIKLNGISLPTESVEDCITVAEAKDAKTTVAKELKRNECLIKSWKIKGQNLTAKISCASREIQADGILTGQFTKKSYILSGNATGTYQNLIPSVAHLKLEGVWISACK